RRRHTRFSRDWSSDVCSSDLGVSLVAGRVLVGYLVDRLWAPGVAFVALATPAVGCFILATLSDNPLLVVMGVAMIGVGAGAEFDLAAFLVARYFGMRDYARLFGLQMAVISGGICLAPTLAAFLYETFGNYDAVLTVNMVLFMIGSTIRSEEHTSELQSRENLVC